MQSPKVSKQVDSAHYRFSRYMSKMRWASLWHQIDEVLSFSPDAILEIGPGPGLFRANLKALGYNVNSLDIDPALKPDIVATATALPFQRSSIDVVCAFQVLEHLPFETAIKVLAEMHRVAAKGVVISLPDARTCWPQTIRIPKIGRFDLQIPHPMFKPRKHIFNGQHYWEINKTGYELDYVKTKFLAATSQQTVRTFLVHENPYHRFFVFTKSTEE